MDIVSCLKQAYEGSGAVVRRIPDDSDNLIDYQDLPYDDDFKYDIGNFVDSHSVDSFSLNMGEDSVDVKEYVQSNNGNLITFSEISNDLQDNGFYLDFNQIQDIMNCSEKSSLMKPINVFSFDSDNNHCIIIGICIEKDAKALNKMPLIAFKVARAWTYVKGMYDLQSQDAKDIAREKALDAPLEALHYFLNCNDSYETLGDVRDILNSCFYEDSYHVNATNVIDILIKAGLVTDGSSSMSWEYTEPYQNKGLSPKKHRRRFTIKGAQLVALKLLDVWPSFIDTEEAKRFD